MFRGRNASKPRTTEEFRRENAACKIQKRYKKVN